MIGFKNPLHHGWKLASLGLQRQCPYPEGSQAYEDFWIGARRYATGKNWDDDAKEARRQQRRQARAA